MDSSRMDDKIFDSILAQVLEDVETEDFLASKRLYDELKDGEPIPTSRGFDKKMKKLLAKLEQPGRPKAIRLRRLLVAAAIIAALLATGIVASAEGFKLFEWLGIYKEDSTTFHFNRYDYSSYEAQIADAGLGHINLPQYIPEGYIVGEVHTLSKGMRLNYFGPSGSTLRVMIRRMGENDGVSLDTEEAIIKRFEFKGYDAFYSENDKVCILLFSTNVYLYRIEATALPEEELLRIAEGIELQ